MKKEAVAKRKRNRKKLTRIDKIEKALQKLIEEGEKVSKRIKEISEENERGFRELREITARTSERVDKTSEEVAKTSEEIRKLKTEISRLTGSWGEFVEGMIEPSAIKFMEEKGFKVVGVYPEAKVSRDGENAEYDLYLVCVKSNNTKNKGNNNRKKEKVILLVSAKTKVSSRDVDELLEDMRKFFFFLEEYKGYKLMGAIAGIRFGKGADIYALRSGLIVMKPAGEVMQIQEPKKIRFVE
jgi:regulator of replication initiation timing